MTFGVPKGVRDRRNEIAASGLQHVFRTLTGQLNNYLASVPDYFERDLI